MDGAFSMEAIQEKKFKINLIPMHVALSVSRDRESRRETFKGNKLLQARSGGAPGATGTSTRIFMIIYRRRKLSEPKSSEPRQTCEKKTIKGRRIGPHKNGRLLFRVNTQGGRGKPLE